MATMPVSEKETLKTKLDLLAKIEKALDDLPHKLARPALHDVEELRDVLAEEMPGGLFGVCESCELPIGGDEAFVGNEDGNYFCEDCVKRFEEKAA